MKKKILIVDDDIAILKALSLIIENEGYEAEITLRGETLLGTLPSQPDLILLDRRLSGIDGLDICKHLKTQLSTKGIPIIMISATDDLETLSRIAGANDFVEKPFNIHELLDKVRRLVCVQG